MKGWKWLVLILGLALWLRTYNVNWDDGYHFHPDERWIVMVAEKLAWVNPVTQWEEFKMVESRMNPKFFAYGSLPIYLLAVVGWLVGEIFNRPALGNYAELNLVGRVLSAVFDTGTVLLVYLIGKRLGETRNYKLQITESNSARANDKQISNLKISSYAEATKDRQNSKLQLETIGLWAALLYGVCVLPIQLSHFYAVDTVLTFWVMGTLYCLIGLIESETHPSSLRRGPLLIEGNILWWAMAVGLAIGAAVATKTSGVMLVVPVVVGILLRNKGNWGEWGKKGLWKWMIERVIWMLIIALIAGITFVILEPYAVIDWVTFVKNHREQAAMTRDAWVFPYTLQYVGTMPYVYHIENMVKWGMGWVLGITSIVGVIIVSWFVIKEILQKITNFKLQISNKSSNIEITNIAILLSFGVVYFGVTGRFAVKFMRYMLPIYPLLCIFGVLGIWMGSKLLVGGFSRIMANDHEMKSKKVFMFLCSFVFLLTVVWTGAFMRIYTKENTRITASRWMAGNLRIQEPESRSQNKVVLGIEHWDDALPVPPWIEGFEQVSLPLYERDTEMKWRGMADNLENIDAIVLASNRLYGPLMRLKEFPWTARYYELLFAEQLGFEKAGEFEVYPGIGPPAGGWLVDDQGADESFTVYDHPKVTVFRKVEWKSEAEYYGLVTGSAKQNVSN